MWYKDYGEHAEITVTPLVDPLPAGYTCEIPVASLGGFTFLPGGEDCRLAYDDTVAWYEAARAFGWYGLTNVYWPIPEGIAAGESRTFKMYGAYPLAANPPEEVSAPANYIFWHNDDFESYAFGVGLPATYSSATGAWGIVPGQVLQGAGDGGVSPYNIAWYTAGNFDDLEVSVDVFLPLGWPGPFEDVGIFVYGQGTPGPLGLYYVCKIYDNGIGAQLCEVGDVAAGIFTPLGPPVAVPDPAIAPVTIVWRAVNDTHTVTVNGVPVIFGAIGVGMPGGGPFGYVVNNNIVADFNNAWVRKAVPNGSDPVVAIDSVLAHEPRWQRFYNEFKHLRAIRPFVDLAAGTEIVKLLTVIKNKLVEFLDLLNDVYYSTYIYSATGIALDYHGEAYELERYDDEPDLYYRDRLLLKKRRDPAFCTEEALVDVIDEVLGAPPTVVRHQDGSFDWSPSRLDEEAAVGVRRTGCDWSPTRGHTWVSMLNSQTVTFVIAPGATTAQLDLIVVGIKAKKLAQMRALISEDSGLGYYNLLREVY